MPSKSIGHPREPIRDEHGNFVYGENGKRKTRPIEDVWRARYRDDDGHEHAAHFDTKHKAQAWLDQQTAALVTGTHVEPRKARTTVEEWCTTWLEGYTTHRPSTIRQARVHVKHIVAAFGKRKLSSVRPSEVKTWTARLKADGYAPATIHALHGKLGQIYADAIHDGLVVRSPVSRRTSPPAGRQRPYVATTEQVWALHDLMPAGLKPAILLGAFAGLRVAEIAALRVSDVDFMHGVITPAIQYRHEPLKTAMSKTPIPIPHELALELNRIPSEWHSTTLVVGATGRPVSPHWIEQIFRDARSQVDGLPDGFRVHDLRHYYASMLIAAGLDVKVVQARLRHASAKTTLDTYGHLWPDSDDTSRAAVADVLKARSETLRTSCGLTGA